MADTLDISNVCMEGMGNMYPGDLRCTQSSLVFKNKFNGKSTMVSLEDIDDIETTYLANQHAIRILTKDGDLHRFGKFDESAFNKLKTYIATKWKHEISNQDLSIKGWNYGETEIVGKNLQFKVNGTTAFEIPLSNVANCSTNKNEAIIEFHGNDDCSVGLMEMRFHIPQPEGGNEDELASEIFRDKVMQFADVEVETEQPIVLLTGMPCITPRGRYDIKVFPTFLSFHGKTYDYKILSKSVIRLFLLPHTDNRRVYFVMHINPPIRQGQTRYNYIVFEFNKEERAELELSLTEAQIKKDYAGKIEKNLNGALYEIVVKLFRVFVGIKVTIPSKDAGAINCSHKQSHGSLYPMEKGFMYVPKPPIYIRHEEISSINFARSDITTKTFDLEITTKTSGTSFTFNSVGKDDFNPLLEFCQSKNLPVVNVKSLQNRKEVSLGLMDVDPYKERLKADALSDMSDSDESDEDFDVQKEATKKKKKTEDDSSATDGSEPEEEYATSDGSVEEEEPKEKKKKPEKSQSHKSSSSKKEKESGKADGKKKAKDPNAPKRPQTAFFMWLGENRAKILEENPGFNGVSDVAKEAGVRWKTLTEEDKKPFEEKVKKDKERYEKEMEAYKASGGGAAFKATSGGSTKKSGGSPLKKSSFISPSKAKSKEFVSSSDDSSDDSDADDKKKKSKKDEKSKKDDKSKKKETKKKTPSASEGSEADTDVSDDSD